MIQKIVLQPAICNSIYEPMSDIINVGGYYMIDVNSKYIDDVMYIKVYTLNGQEIGDIPLKHFSLVDEYPIIILKEHDVNLEELSYRYNKEPTTVDSTTKLQVYDIRQLTDERINEILTTKK